MGEVAGKDVEVETKDAIYIAAPEQESLENSGEVVADVQREITEPVTDALTEASEVTIEPAVNVEPQTVEKSDKHVESPEVDTASSVMVDEEARKRSSTQAEEKVTKEPAANCRGSTDRSRHAEASTARFRRSDSSGGA